MSLPSFMVTSIGSNRLLLNQDPFYLNQDQYAFLHYTAMLDTQSSIPSQVFLAMMYHHRARIKPPVQVC